MVRLISVALLALAMSGCFEEIPDQYDGDLSLELAVVFEDDPVQEIEIKLNTDEYLVEEFCDTTDSAGNVSFEGLPWASYQMVVRGCGIVPAYEDSTALDTLLFVGTKELIPEDSNTLSDTLFVQPSGAEPGLKLNEIYTCGPPNNFFYFYDQYFELYNSSEDTIYLDGMIFCRMGKFLISVTYIFQFPGTPLTGRDYPIGPGEFKVVAGDAFDHSTIVPGSIDLSNADFEFRNKLDYGDVDNPDVPNLDNIEVGHTRDFLVGLTGDVLLIADGSDLNYLDGIDIESVIDCVEYSSYSLHEKEIEDELDRSFGGVGQVKYSGSSLERIAAGFDSNSSAEDFEIISVPTIGYQHAPE